jgi:hypothetical protein
MIAALEIAFLVGISTGAPDGERSPAFSGLVLAALESPALGVETAAGSVNDSQAPPSLCTDLTPGWRLNAGESLFSALGAFRLIMQDDGNLVLYAIDDMKLPRDILSVLASGPDVLKLYVKPLWSTGTHLPREGKARGCYCVMQEDGNFVVFDNDGHPTFETGTAGHPGSFLRIQSDGNLVIYTHDVKRSIWASNTAARASARDERKVKRVSTRRRDRPALKEKRGLPAQLSMDLRPRWRLNRGDSLYSALGGFRLTLEEDGNLVLYAIDDQQIPPDAAPLLLHEDVPLNIYQTPVWATGTEVFRQSTGPGAYCIMKEDGNFVIYDDDDNPCYQSGTTGNPGAFLRCQDDGNLVIYTREKKPVWQSQTYARIVNP